MGTVGGASEPLAELVRATLANWTAPPEDDPRALRRFVALHPAYQSLLETLPKWFVPATKMGPRRWPVIALRDVAEVAELVGENGTELDWLADRKSLERQVQTEQLRNYRYRWVAKRSGRMRLLEAPKPRLKAMQRAVVDEVLNRIPAHPAAHGFVTGRSVRSFAAAHVGQAVVVRLDLDNFFTSVTAGRVYGLYRTAGYPAHVAHHLTAMCTNTVPWAVWRALPPLDNFDERYRLGRLLRSPHLPQGAPTSPQLANLAAFRLDRRLTGLAAAFEGRYTRYADDLAFSIPDLAGAGRLVSAATAVVAASGFRVNLRKTAVMPASGRQQLAGVVVNEGPNVIRSEFDRLKATLHNCAQHGPASQNRDGVADYSAHLRGRVAWVAQLNPERGAKLLGLYDAIDWG